MKSVLTAKKLKRMEKLLSELEQLRVELRLEKQRRDVRTLSARRQELVNTIRDHKEVSFDFLARNFRAVPISTLHYDLLQLIKHGYIQKMGSTRGVCYTLRTQ